MNAVPDREALAAVRTAVEFGAILKKARDATGLSIRGLERKATDSDDGGPPRYVELMRNLVDDMEHGRRLEGKRANGEADNRLELYLWCCRVPKDDLPAWLETRHRVLHEPRREPEPQASLSAAVKTTLRRDARAFIGRDAELRRILATDDLEHTAPIYTIDGMAGVGKTALANHAAHQLAGRFPDGRYFVELHAHTPGRAVADPADVLASLLISLGVDVRYVPDTLEARRDLWRDRLIGKRVLLVLDDAKDLAQVEPLLPTGTGCLTLITSRRRLITLDNAVPLALEMLEPQQAIQLFTTLAHRRTDSEADRTAVARIVRLCGHLPLAITLLAGRLAHHSTWTIAELADEFTAATNRLDELDAGARVVRAAFDLSYRDLPPGRELLFRRLGLHTGSDLDAHAAAALADIDVETARWELESLYNDHLLDEPARGRYRLHDLLREYARALVAVEPDRDRAVARHRLLDYYRTTATAADRWLARWTRPVNDPDELPSSGREFTDEIQALAWMRLERENLLACLADTADRDRAQLIAAMAGLLDRDGPWSLARRLHERAVDTTRSLGDRLGEAGSLNSLGAVHWRAGDYRAAIDRFETALTLYRRSGNRLGEANALNNLAKVCEETGDYPRAVELHEQALDGYRTLANRLGEANALNDLGSVREETGDYADAAELHERALGLYHQLGNRLGEANALNNLGIVRTRTGQHAEAIGLHQQALDLYHQLGNRLGEANALNNLGIVRTRTGQHAEAIGLHQQALDLYHQLGNRLGEASALNNLGIVRTRTGLHAEAIGLHQQALDLYHQLGNRLGEASALNNLGIVRTRTGQHAEAIGLHQQALVLFRQLGNRRGEAEVLIDIGKLEIDNHARRDALDRFAAALRIYEQLEAPEAAELTAYLRTLEDGASPD